MRDPKVAASQPYVPDMSTQSNAPGRDTSIELKSPEANLSLEGTTWTGNRPETGEYTIKFLKSGQLEYIINVMQNGVTAPRTVKGTWKQAGSDVQITIGASYSVLQGTLEGNVMKGSATNQEGVEWKWTLFKKQ